MNPGAQEGRSALRERGAGTDVIGPEDELISFKDPLVKTFIFVVAALMLALTWAQ